MRINSLTIVIASLAVLYTADGFAGSRGKRNSSPGGEFSFQIESEGRVLPVYTHGGRSYVEGVWGASYGIRVMNHTGRRVEAVVTVDGRDVVSGRVGNYRKERGYVIDPYDSVLIKGFRRSWNDVAAFTFTDVGDSYAARMGDATNVGVIGVAVFEEKRYRPRPVPVLPYAKEEARPETSQGLGSGYGRKSAPKRGAARTAPSAESRAYDDSDRSQGLGTAYGDDTYSPSTQTTFTRESRRPEAVMAIRYDDRDGLYRLGVLPRYRYRRAPRPEPFPNSAEPVSFAPPPPPRQWWE